MIDNFAWFLIGIGLTLLTISALGTIIILVIRYRARRFRSFLDKIQEAGEKLVSGAGKEISELTFRDKHGVPTTVRIIIDPALDDMRVEDRRSMQEMLKTGDAGTLEDLMAGHKISEDAIGKVQEFVFSPQAVRDMRSVGIEPDEVVTKMLKASGRMA